MIYCYIFTYQIKESFFQFLIRRNQLHISIIITDLDFSNDPGFLKSYKQKNPLYFSFIIPLLMIKYFILHCFIYKFIYMTAILIRKNFIVFLHHFIMKLIRSF